MIEDLLIEFDEMGFAPTTLCENPEKYAVEWKKRLVAEIDKLQTACKSEWIGERKVKIMAYKRKFKRGDRITSLDELASQKWIYVFDKITHNGWFMSWQFRTAQDFMKRGNLYYALPNDDRRKEGEGK